MRVETISYIKKNAATLELDEPILVTQNGVPAYVIESWSAQQQRENAIALLKMMTLSEQDKQDGNVMSKEALLAGIGQSQD
ncbi:type II toxin-antitoxin system Phd/YefM family antitoxin [Siccibacter turicensis]|uniref:type II toxin-antitoxin system Phd/YefM family antitoxin n=1 Tax=Siccibacter turicensis TaxID=357233 RepID=UPI003F5451C1